MIVDIVKNIPGYKGTYTDKVKALMRFHRSVFRATRQSVENPIELYDYGSYYLKKRTEGTVSGIVEARRRFCDILSTSQIDAMFAFSNAMILKGGYNYEVDGCNAIALSSAIWILDELLLSGNIDKVYQYLPMVEDAEYKKLSSCTDPSSFSVKHPVYEDDLICLLVYLIRHRNSSKTAEDIAVGSLVWESKKPDSDEKSSEYRSAFDSIMALLNPDSVREATQHFEEKVWEFYRLSFSIMAAVEKKENALTQELNDLQNQSSDNIAEVMNSKNILLMPNKKKDILKDIISNGKNFDRRQADIRRIENEIDRLQGVTFTCLSLPNDREKLVKSLKGIISPELTEKLIAFHVDDPFESSFALLHLLETNSLVPWYYYGSISVAYTLCDQLPYDTRQEIPNKTIKLSSWNSALYQHRYKGYRFNDMTDADGEPVMREYAKNLSQLVFSNTLSLFPRVVPEQAELTTYFNDLGVLSEHEKEAYSLLSYALVAGQLRTGSIREYQAVQNLKQMLENDHDEIAVPQNSEDGTQLKIENERLRAKNKKLVDMVSCMLADHKADSKQMLLLRHQIELQEKELSDLREAVYLLENDKSGEVPADESIRYPYATPGKIVSFGGHDTWLKEMRRKLPNVIFVGPDSLPNIDLIRNADAVWLQINCLSHSDFFRIIKIVRQNGIPLRYFSFAGSEKCAEQLIKTTD